MIVLVMFSTIMGTVVTLNYFFASSMERDYFNEDQRSYTIDGRISDIDKKFEEFVSDRKSDLQRVYAVIHNKGDLIISNYYGESLMSFKVQLGRYFSDDLPSKKEILIPSNTPDGVDSLGKPYTIGDEEFLIIGISSLESYEIPYDALDSKDEIDGIVIVAKDKLDNKSKALIVGDIERIFGTDKIAYPEEVSDQYQMAPDYLLIIGTIFLGVLNFAFVFRSLLEKRKKQQAVFYILGCRKSRIILLYTGEIFTIVTAVFFFCALFAKYCLYNILNTFDAFFYHVMSAKQYFALYLIYASVVIFITVFQLILWGRKTPFELKRR